MGVWVWSHRWMWMQVQVCACMSVCVCVCGVGGGGGVDVGVNVWVSGWHPLWLHLQSGHAKHLSNELQNADGRLRMDQLAMRTQQGPS